MPLPKRKRLQRLPDLLHDEQAFIMAWSVYPELWDHPFRQRHYPRQIHNEMELEERMRLKGFFLEVYECIRVEGREQQCVRMFLSRKGEDRANLIYDMVTLT